MSSFRTLSDRGWRVRLLPHVRVSIMLMGVASAGCHRQLEGDQKRASRLQRLSEDARILFASNRDTWGSRCEIYSMDADGGNVTRITTTHDNHFLMGIDRSRRYVVATRGTEKRKRVWLLDLETGEETPLTAARNHAEGRTFSPDGEWIVFWMVESGKKYSDIYKIRRDGVGLTNLTNTPEAHELDPAWSNGGDAIAFNFTDRNSNRFMLKTMAPDGTNVRTVYSSQDSAATAAFPAGVYDPSWSQDDQWILVEEPVQFTGRGENGRAGVWRLLKVRADGADVVDLTSKGAHGRSAVYAPSFSPDGESILFTSRYGPEKPSRVSVNIFTMEGDGGGLVQLTSGPHVDQAAIWIP